MPRTEEHPLIAFAGTYGDPLSDYLNAFVALDRLDTLLNESARGRGPAGSKLPCGTTMGALGGCRGDFLLRGRLCDLS